MLRKLLAVAMVAALAMGTAWGATLEEDLSLSPTDYENQTLNIGSTQTYSRLAIHSGGTNTYTTANPYKIGALNLGGSAHANIGNSTGGGKNATPSQENVVVRIGTVTFAPALTDTWLQVSSRGYLEITNEVTVDGDSNRIALYGGTVSFNGGAVINNTRGLRTSGGEILAGAGGAITLRSRRALYIDTAGNTVKTEVDAGTVDFIVDYATGNGAYGAIEWAPGTNPAETANLTVNSLIVNNGLVRLGEKNTTFSANDLVYLGDVADPPASPTAFKSAQIRLSNAGGTTTWNNGVIIGAGGNIYTADDAANGDTVNLTVGEASQTGSGTILIQGSDLLAGGIANLDATGAPLHITDASGDSEIQLRGTLVGLAGTIETVDAFSRRMDMNVSLSADAIGFVNNAIAAAPGSTIARYLSLPATGDKFRGIGLIGDPLNGNATVVSIQNYEQESGILLGTGGLAGKVLAPLNFGASRLDIHGETEVTGGIFAVDAHVHDDMRFHGASFNQVDTAILGGIGQTIANQAAAGTSLFLDIGANAAINLSLAGMTIQDMNTTIDGQGDLVFGAMPAPGIMVPNDMILAIAGTGTRTSTFSALNSGSVKFSEGFLKTDFSAAPYGINPLAVLARTTNANSTLNIASTEFDGLFGYFRTTTLTAGGVQSYVLDRYVGNGINFDGSATDFGKANGKLNSMYGDQTNGGLNSMIYRSASGGGATDPYARLYVADNASAAQINSFTMNMNNLQNFAAGRREARGILNLYNGNSVNSVNMVAQSVARSHIRTAVGHSDELRETWNLVRNAVSADEALAASIMNSKFANRVWVGGFGLWEDADDNDGLAGYKYKSGGFVAGYDRAIGQNFLVGGSFAYTRGSFEDKAAIDHDSDIDNYSFNLYATYTHKKGFFGTLFGGYTYSDNDIGETYLDNLNNRARADQDNHTNTWYIGGKVGYEWKPVKCLTIAPSIGLTYINAKTNGQTTTLGGNTLGYFSSMKDEALYLPLEIHFGYDVLVKNDSKLNLNANVGYAYNFDEDGVSGTVALAGFQNGVPYTASSREQGHNLFNVGAGATYSKGRFDVGVKYDYYRQSDADTHRVLGTVGIKF